MAALKSMRPSFYKNWAEILQQMLRKEYGLCGFFATEKQPQKAAVVDCF